jgi:anti-anti-sigma factor
VSTKHASHWLEREDIGEVTVVRLMTPKVLDDDIIRVVFESIYSLASDMRRTRLVLNLAAADYLPSMALGKLVMLNRMVQAGGGRLALCQLTPPAREILDTTHLSDVLSIHATEAEALQSFPQG